MQLQLTNACIDRTGQYKGKLLRHRQRGRRRINCAASLLSLGAWHWDSGCGQWDHGRVRGRRDNSSGGPMAVGDGLCEDACKKCAASRWLRARGFDRLATVICLLRLLRAGAQREWLAADALLPAAAG